MFNGILQKQVVVQVKICARQGCLNMLAHVGSSMYTSYVPRVFCSNAHLYNLRYYKWRPNSTKFVPFPSILATFCYRGERIFCATHFIKGGINYSKTCQNTNI